MDFRVVPLNNPVFFTVPHRCRCVGLARFEVACGVVRTASGLESFLHWLETQPEVTEVTLGRLVARAALARPQSLGAHFRADDTATEDLATAAS